MATLSDYNGQDSFTIGGNSFTNRASSGTPIYERTGGGDGGSGGGSSGVIDQVVKVNGGTGTLANFDNNTQMVMAQAVSNSGSSNFCGAQVQVPANDADTVIMKVGSGSLTTIYAKMRLNSDGSYNLTDTSRDHTFDFYITRFSKT